MKKGLKITISIISSLLILILLFLSVYYLWPWNKEFFNNADKEFTIPGLDSEFVPQGMTKIDGYEDKYLICGYMNDNSPSRYYVVNSKENTIEKYFTLNINGKKYNGHAGGVASYGSAIWTVSQEEVNGVKKGYGFYFLLSDVMKDGLENGSEVEVRGHFDTYNNADFVFVQDKYLWVGEFYKPEKYETSEFHRLETRSGEQNPAMAYAFYISEGATNNCALYSTQPQKALSIRGLVQGIAVTNDGNFILSTSYSLPNSNIYYYKDVLNEPAHMENYRIGTFSVPLWYLDNEALISEIEAPSMAEELVVDNERVYILFESACKKYKLFNRKRLENVYSMPLTYFKG